MNFVEEVHFYLSVYKPLLLRRKSYSLHLKEAHLLQDNSQMNGGIQILFPLYVNGCILQVLSADGNGLADVPNLENIVVGWGMPRLSIECVGVDCGNLFTEPSKD